MKKERKKKRRDSLECAFVKKALAISSPLFESKVGGLEVGQRPKDEWNRLQKR